MDIRWVGDFLDLAETLNFTKTANNRHITQPALSRRIRSLEHWVGEPLFDRSTKPIQLTAGGVRFRPVALDVFKKAMAVKEYANLSQAAEGDESVPLPADRSRPVLLVMPLTNVADDNRDAHLSNGFAETVVHELTQSHFVDVLPAPRAPGPDESHRKIAEDLGADFVLEGTYLTHGDQVRIFNNLVSVGSAKSLFSRTNEVTSDAFNRESQVVAITVAWAVSRFVRSKVAGSAQDKPEWGRTAYENFVIGLEVLRSDFATGYEKAQPLFETALEMQPDYADAMMGMALCSIRRWAVDIDKNEDHQQAFRMWCNRALAADSENAVTVVLKSISCCYQRDFEQAELLMKRALQIGPHDPAMRVLLSFVQLCLGDYEGAEASYRAILTMDTGAMDDFNISLGVTYYADQKYETCANILDSILTPEQRAAALSLKMAALAMLGDAAGVDDLRPQLEAKLSEHRQRFAMEIFPLKDGEAEDRLIEGFRKAGILSQVRTQERRLH